MWRRTVLLAALAAAACGSPPTQVPVTLTSPAPTPTSAAVELVPAMQVGAELVHADGATLVAVPHGPFIMGHGTADNPEHTVTLSDFWIYATPVTNHQYSVCVAQGRCAAPSDADNPAFLDFEGQNLPVVGVTYEQAKDYCQAMNADLPTEAQWEKATRGADGRLYPWGDEAPSCELLNFDACVRRASAVTSYREGASPYGALEMAGNVFEWVADWYDPIYYEIAPSGDPPGPAGGRARVIRSSSFRSNATQSLSYARSYGAPGDHRPDLGFRCVVKDPRHFAPACQLAPVLDQADLLSVQADCPVISIDVQTTACRYGGGAVVTFNNDHAQDPNASFGGIVGCTLRSGSPGSFPLTYECRRASTAVMSSSCTYSRLPEPRCPLHYTADATSSLCLWDASRTAGIECPTGEFYDPVRHCCMVASGDLLDFPVCPPGTVFTLTGPSAYACLPAQGARHVPSQRKGINPPVCPGLCELTIDQCAVRNLVFCETTCSCLTVGVKCPTH